MFESSLVEAEESIPEAMPLWKRVGIGLFGMIGVGVLVAVLGLQAWYSDKVMTGVQVGGIDLSGQTLSEARATLQKAITAQHPSFVIAGIRYQPTLAELGTTYHADVLVSRAYRQGREGYIAHPVHASLALMPTVDESRLAAFIEPIIHIGTAPSDARLEVHKGVVQVVPEVSGWSIDKSRLVEAVKTNLVVFDAPAPVIEPEVLAASVKAPDLAAAQTEAESIMATDIRLTEGDTVIRISPAEIAGWLQFDTSTANTMPETKLDPTKIGVYVASLSKRLDVPAVDKKVTIADGVLTVQNEGTDGNAIDREPIAAALSSFVPKQPLFIPITRHTVAFKTQTTNLVGIGSGKYVEINLSKQHLWAWENHKVIYDSPITSGATGAGLGTVIGNFAIYLKQTHTHLVGRDYDVPVNFWMPFYLGYGLHDAAWRHGNFGGPDYWRGGSHGCVNLPDATAAWLYDWTEVGTPVWVHL